MALYFAQGSSSTELSTEDLKSALASTFEQLGDLNRVLAIPPDFTRANSRAGILTSLAYEYFGEKLVDVLPALGTHRPMSEEELNEMFPGLPHSLVREHDWRRDVLTIGQVPGEVVSQMTDGIFDRPWPAQLNRMLWEGGHDLILSIGQVVPHEVIGMANYNKNIFVGTGGEAGINEGHYIGAVYGMERMMGRADTPLRNILNYAEKEFCSHLPLLYILTVVGSKPNGELVTRGLYIGDDPECFEAACELSVEVNFEQLDKPLDKVVCYLDPKEFKSTWLGNKAVYRTRMAIADGGHLIVLGPAIKEFGEKEEIDLLIRKYGYRTQDEIEKAVAENEDLRANLSAAAHLIHGSSEGRFRVTYCPGHLTREEIEGVGYEYADLDSMLERYPIDRLNGYHETADGESYYYIHNPALGLWAAKERLV